MSLYFRLWLIICFFLFVNRCAVDRGIIVIPKSVSKSRIAENFSIWDFKLTKEDVEKIGGLDCNGRLIPQAE